MANPQPENGYTKLANEILEALAKIRIPGEAGQVLDVVGHKVFRGSDIEKIKMALWEVANR